MLPMLPHGKTTYTRSVVQIKDITYRDYAGDGEIRDSYGITSSEAPYIKTANARAEIDSNIDDIAEWNGLVMIKGGVVYYDGEAIGNVSPGQKQFAVVNTKLCIFPDKVYIDLTARKAGSLEAKVVNDSVSITGDTLTVDSTPAEVIPGDFTFYNWEYPNKMPWVNKYTSITVQGGTAVKTGKKPIPIMYLNVGDILCPKMMLNQYSIVKEDGVYCSTLEEYESLLPFEYPEIPDRPEVDDGTYATVTSIDVYHIGTQYELYSVEWKVHTRRPFSFGNDFVVGNRLSVIGEDGTVYADKAEVVGISGNTLTFADGTFSEDVTIPGNTTIIRNVPDLDYICESENRLWGCSGNTIYASALGDPTNFYQYGEESTSSYAVAVSSEDPFTGCAKYSSSVLFFKEKIIHKVLGSYPAEYAVYTTNAEGVKSGCERSLVTINNVLYYYGLHGVYAYTGGTPSPISANFGNKRFSEAVGGTDGRFYYLSVKEGDDGLYFAYDINTGIWCKQADRYASRFVLVGVNMLYLNDGNVYDADTGVPDTSVDWLVRFAPFERSDEAAYAHKAQYERIIFHAVIPTGSYIDVYVSADGKSRQHITKLNGANGVFVWTAVVPVNRVENYGLELAGHGASTIKTITREYQTRSER